MSVEGGVGGVGRGGGIWVNLAVSTCYQSQTRDAPVMPGARRKSFARLCLRSWLCFFCLEVVIVLGSLPPTTLPSPPLPPPPPPTALIPFGSG